MHIRSGRRYVFILLFSICVFLLIYSTYQLLEKQSERREAIKEYQELAYFVESGKLENETKEDNIRHTIVATLQPKEDGKKDNSKTEENLLMDIYERNSDFVGWLSLEGTTIEYPVVQNKEKTQFYLNHDFNKKKSRYGVPFLDQACDLRDTCCNLLIYGHHMKDGTMFAGLMKYQDKDYYEQHKEITFTTLEEQTKFSICAVCKVNAESDADIFSYLSNNHTQDGFTIIKEFIKQKQLYDCEYEFNEENQLLTLATCEYSQENGRLIVIAIKID